GVKGTWTSAMTLSPDQVKTSTMDLSVIRQESGPEGIVLCFVKGEETPDGVLARVDQFHKTGDLAALGKVRYAFASASKSGGSMVVAMWTDGSFNMRKIVGRDGG